MNILVPIIAILSSLTLASCNPTADFSGNNASNDGLSSSDSSDSTASGSANGISDSENGGSSKNNDINEDNGVLGGHFDLDTSTDIYPLNQGSTDGHVHEYDDKYDVEDANFFDLRSEKLQNVQEVLGENQKFRIIVQNANLSPMVKLELNGTPTDVLTFAQNFNAKDVYSLAGADESQTLNSMRLVLSKDAFLKKGVISTATGCVRNNNPGKNGEYRSGALVVQIVDADNNSIDANTGFLASGLIWEAALFWHESSSCY